MDTPKYTGLTPTVTQSTKARKAATRDAQRRNRSPFPRSPKHGKHAFVQGDPNTRSHAR